MVVGIDDSEHSMYALQWTLDHFFTPFAGDGSLFKLVVTYSFLRRQPRWPCSCRGSSGRRFRFEEDRR
ncbi:hypothetical protein LINPERPRIM_LOCUS35845 [Linum perenne]